MYWHSSFTVASLLASALAIPTGHVMHEKRTHENHLERRLVEHTAILPIRIGLKQRNLELGHDLLMEVSSPDSPRYGQHYNNEEIANLFAPAEEASKAVLDWLMGAGFSEDEIMHYENRAWIAVDMLVTEAEELFSTTYYEHTMSDGHMRIGCDEYYLPANIAKHVDLIKPGVALSPRIKKRTLEKRGGSSANGAYHPPKSPLDEASVTGELSRCDSHITPPCIKALYGIPDVPAHTSPENVIGFYEIGDAFSKRDLALYFKRFLPHITKGTFPHVYSIDGGVAPVPVHSRLNTGESDIDLALAYGIVYPQKVVVYQVDDIPTSAGMRYRSGFLNDFFDAVDGSYCTYKAFGIKGNSPKIDPTYPDPLKGGYKGQLQCGVYPLTRVVSISYGGPEMDYPKNYLQRQCSEIMKLGMMGHSILVASGDSGVAEYPGASGNENGCLSAKGMHGKIYNSDWPSSCPFITAVGGTRLPTHSTVNTPEVAMQVNLAEFNDRTGQVSGTPPNALRLFATGGGFSNFFPVASYQKEAVEKYFANNNVPPSYSADYEATNIGQGGGLYNRNGRGYPDVAANGAYLSIYNNGTLQRLFGTSLSSPIFASVLTLVNEDRTAAGKGPVGFVNPVLYANPQVLNDITKGSNPGCGSEGFKASTGWDPVTGLGTPNYPAMSKLFLTLP